MMKFYKYKKFGGQGCPPYNTRNGQIINGGINKVPKQFYGNPNAINGN